MALLGGAGNIAGSNPAGTGTGLNHIGDFAYAYSGNIAALIAETTMLSFTTGSSLFVGDLVCNGHNNAATPGTGVVASLFFVKINSEVIAMMKVETATETAPTQCFTTLIIPPYSIVEIVTVAQDDEADRFATAVLTGRIYDD